MNLDNTSSLQKKIRLIHNRTLFLFDCDVAELSSMKSIKLYWFLLDHTIHFVHFSSYKSNPCIHFPGNSFHISKKRASWLKTGDDHADKPTILRFQKHMSFPVSSFFLVFVDLSSQVNTMPADWLPYSSPWCLWRLFLVVSTWLHLKWTEF